MPLSRGDQLRMLFWPKDHASWRHRSKCTRLLRWRNPISVGARQAAQGKASNWRDAECPTARDHQISFFRPSAQQSPCFDHDAKDLVRQLLTDSPVADDLTGSTMVSDREYVIRTDYETRESLIYSVNSYNTDRHLRLHGELLHAPKNARR